MPIKPERTAAKRVAALLTILAIAGTLSACGRYGRPVRPKASPSMLNTPSPNIKKLNIEARGIELPDAGTQNARIEKPIRIDLRTALGHAPSVLRSSLR
jgi:hypothetical protein